MCGRSGGNNDKASQPWKSGAGGGGGKEPKGPKQGLFSCCGVLMQHPEMSANSNFSLVLRAYLVLQGSCIEVLMPSTSNCDL